MAYNGVVTKLAVHTRGPQNLLWNRATRSPWGWGAACSAWDLAPPYGAVLLCIRPGQRSADHDVWGQAGIPLGGVGGDCMLLKQLCLSLDSLIWSEILSFSWFQTSGLLRNIADPSACKRGAYTILPGSIFQTRLWRPDQETAC